MNKKQVLALANPIARTASGLLWLLVKGLTVSSVAMLALAFVVLSALVLARLASLFL